MSRNTLTIASREPFKGAIWDTWPMVDLTMNGNEMVDLTTGTGYPIFRQAIYSYPYPLKTSRNEKTSPFFPLTYQATHRFENRLHRASTRCVHMWWTSRDGHLRFDTAGTPTRNHQKSHTKIPRDDDDVSDFYATSHTFSFRPGWISILSVDWLI